MTTIALLDNFEMPVFKFMNLETLFDTGANKSVANFSDNMFKLIFGNKIKSQTPGEVSGFGGTSKGTDYVISEIDISGVKLKDVTFFVPKQPLKRFKFILAGTLLSKYPYEINMPEHAMTIKTDL